jgi:uncharacterized repeat protein (TIGR02543 family)
MKHNTFKLALAAVACLSAFSFAQIPLLEITTKDRQEPSVSEICTGQNFNGWCMGGTSTEMKYIGVTNIKLSKSSFNFDIGSTTNPPDSIRIRGNSTATVTKKPYRIKFGTKTSMFGREKAKSWVLLANYYDATFALNAIAFRLGQKMGLDFTPHSEFVELKINGSDKGIYQLTEQVQVNPGRVDIRNKKDWLVEFDYHPADPDEIKFNTTRYNLPTFIKSPEVESNFNVNNNEIKFVVDEVNALTDKMYENGFPGNGYRDMIDLESFAKYVLIQQLMDNFDFNSKATGQPGEPGSNFAYRDSTGKIKAGPLWDFDLSAGVTNDNFGKHYNTATEPIRPRHAFYQRLWTDEVFLAKFKKLWDKHQSDFSAATIHGFIDSIQNVLKNLNLGNNIWNNNRNPMNMWGGEVEGPLTADAFGREIGSLKKWWTDRLSSFTTQINAMNIDTSKDIEQTATVTVTFDAMGGSSVPTQTVAIGSKVTRPANPTRSGYTFDGWYKDGGSSTGSFTQPWNFDTDVVNNKVTLYAKWNSGGQIITPPTTTFTVTFNTLSNSAQPTPQAQTVTQGAKATKPADMTRQPAGQWAFKGWCTENGSASRNWGRQWDFATDAVNADVYLYAQWVNAESAAATVTCNNTTNITVKQSALPLGNFTTIKNGFVVNTANNMSITVFNLNGKAIRQQTLTSGNHTVTLGDLPKGMYIVKASFGAGTTPVTLRLAIR